MSDNQTSFANLGSPIGFVSELNGSAVVQSIDGQERVIKLGDPIFFGETVITNDVSQVTIAFIDNTQIVIGSDSIVEMTDEIFSLDNEEELVADATTEEEALQQAILDGADPTAIQDAPAAGEEGADGEQNRVDVSIDRNNDGALGDDYRSSLPSYGYDSNINSTLSLSSFGSGSSFSETDTRTSTSTTEAETTSTTASTLDLPPSIVLLDINPIAGDGTLNTQETSEDILITGSVTGDSFDSGVVTLIVNGVTYTGEVTGNTFSISVSGADLLADSDNTVEASVVVSSDSGQQGSASTVEDYLVDTTTRATIRVNPITSDDVIDAQESGETITVSGRVIGDPSAGDVVSMEINGVSYTTTINADNRTWSVDVAGSDLAEDTSFVVTVTGQDDSGNPFTASTTSTHTVALNEAPVAVDDTATGEEDGGVITIDVLSNDSDANSDTLSITGATVPVEQGTVAVVDGKLEFTPAENFNGEATISYTVSDGLATDTADVTVTVNAVNDDAVIGGDTSGLGAETDAPLSWSGTLTATDVDNEDNTFIAKTTIGENGTFSVDANGEWTFVANSAFDELGVGESAVEEFTVTTAGGTEQTVTMTITGTNDAPVATAATGAVAEDATITGTISAS
ncbi:retention module-containing protein, partial [Marinomonas transparens]